MGRKLLHCNQLILGYTSVQQLHKKHYGSTTYLGGRRRRHWLYIVLGPALHGLSLFLFYSYLKLWECVIYLQNTFGDTAQHLLYIFHIQSHLQCNCSTPLLAVAEWQGILMSRSADNLLCLILPQRHHSGTQQTQEWIWWIINTRI